MHYRPLGRTDLDVSALCLGTMTFGEQNSAADAAEQLDRAVAAGINFIDTAEMYPVPPKPETMGRTEDYIGRWLSARGGRDKLVIATKVAGLDRANIEQALDASLRRLGTDYVDLYQLHWPDRDTNFFGKLGYEHPTVDDSVPLMETLEVLGDLVQAGARSATWGCRTRRPGAPCAFWSWPSATGCRAWSASRTRTTC